MVKMAQKTATPPSTFMAMPSLPEHSFREILGREAPTHEPVPEWTGGLGWKGEGPGAGGPRRRVACALCRLRTQEGPQRGKLHAEVQGPGWRGLPGLG